MKDLKALAVVVVVVLAIYIGVEPYAHSQLHKKVAPVDYEFKDLKEVSSINSDAISGKTLFANNCSSCHSVISDNINPLMEDKDSASAYGVVPPDLSNSSFLYSKKFFVSFVKNPTLATQTQHKFVGDKIYPMPSFDWLGDDKISNIYAYLKSVEPKDISNKEAFNSACVRCHSMKYDKNFSPTPTPDMHKYMGTIPPDLSTMILAKGKSYLHEFINEPSKHLEGTAMPRVGLTKKAEDKVIAYLEEIGDPNIEDRETLGIRFILWAVLLSVVAWIWKIKIWKDVGH